MRYALSLILLIAVSVQGQTLKDWFGDSLVGYWGAQGFAKSGGTGETMYDASGKGNDGTANGNAHFDGDAMVFDGTGDYVDVGKSATELNIVNGYATLTAWVKTSDNSGRIIANYTGGGELLYLAVTGGEAYMDARGSADNLLRVFTGISVDDNNWHFLAAVVENKTLYAYIDGILNSSDTDLNFDGNVESGGDYRIADDPDATARNLNGSIAHAMIFNRALSAEEVNDLYHGMPQLPTDYRPEEVQP